MEESLLLKELFKELTKNSKDSHVIQIFFVFLTDLRLYMQILYK